MKYNLDFNKFTQLIFESLLHEMDINEALFQNVSTWTLIDDRNINSYATKFPKIYAVMNYLKGLPKNIDSFKLPQISKEQDSYELYVNFKIPKLVNKEQKTTKSQFKIELYKFLKNLFDWTTEKQLKDIQIENVDYKIGLVSNALSAKFENSKNIKIIDYKLDSKPANSWIPIGLFIKNENSELELDTLIVFRLNEISDSTDEKAVIKTQAKNANSLVQLAFGNSKNLVIKASNTIDFSNNLIAKLNELNLPQDEFDTYNELFGPNFKKSKAINGNRFDPKQLSDNVKTFIQKSNITVIIAEILIPWLLVNGITMFGNINLIKELLGNKANDKIISVSWPASATHGYTDFSISFAKFESGKEIGFSAKSNEKNYNFPTIIPILLNNKDKFSNLKNTLGLCANTLYKVQQKYPRKSIFYCWCMNSAINQSSIPSDDDIEKLYNVFKGLTSGEEKILQTDKRFNIGLKYVQQKYPEDIAAWPYSITNIYEKNVVKALNNENGINSSRSTFYNILMGSADAFYQIELIKNNSDVFSLKFKKPEKVNQKTDNSSKISFKVLTGPGSRSVNSESDVKVLQDIAKGGGKKAIIGFQLH